MNKKILIISNVVIILIIVFISFVYINEANQWQNQQLEKKKHSTFNIETQDDLKEVLTEVSKEMMENKIFLELGDYYLLYTYDDVNIIRLFPNDMNGFSSGKGTFPDGYSLHEDKKDGTRIWEEFSKNGTLLKSIKIYDEPEKEILILLK